MLGHQEGSCFIVEMMLHYAISPASNYLCHFGLFNYLFNFRRAFHSSVAICGDYHHWWEQLAANAPMQTARIGTQKLQGKPTLYQIKCPSSHIQENLKPSRRFFLKETHLGSWINRVPHGWKSKVPETETRERDALQSLNLLQNKHMATIKHIPLTTNMSTLQRSIYTNLL